MAEKIEWSDWKPYDSGAEISASPCCGSRLTATNTSQSLLATCDSCKQPVIECKPDGGGDLHGKGVYRVNEAVFDSVLNRCGWAWAAGAAKLR